VSDPGARLTRAEKALLHTRELYDRIKEHYEEAEDRWSLGVEESGETISKARYRSMLRAERAGTGDIGMAWRLYQKARVILSRRMQQERQLKREYYDNPRMGTGR